MKIKTELIKSYISEVICSQLTDFEIDKNKVADSKATQILDAVRDILCQAELTDFEINEEIFHFSTDATYIAALVVIFDERCDRLREGTSRFT